MQVILPATRLPLTADGTSAGLVTVASLDRVYVKARGFLTRKGANPASQSVEVGRLAPTTGAYLRFIEHDVDADLPVAPHLSFDSCAAFTVADSATLWFPEQLVSVEPASTKPL